MQLQAGLLSLSMRGQMDARIAKEIAAAARIEEQNRLVLQKQAKEAANIEEAAKRLDMCAVYRAIRGKAESGHNYLSWNLPSEKGRMVSYAGELAKMIKQELISNGYQVITYSTAIAIRW